MAVLDKDERFAVAGRRALGLQEHVAPGNTVQLLLAARAHLRLRAFGGVVDCDCGCVCAIAWPQVLGLGRRVDHDAAGCVDDERAFTAGRRRLREHDALARPQQGRLAVIEAEAPLLLLGIGDGKPHEGPRLEAEDQIARTGLVGEERRLHEARGDVDALGRLAADGRQLGHRLAEFGAVDAARGEQRSDAVVERREAIGARATSHALGVVRAQRVDEIGARRRNQHVLDGRDQEAFGVGRRECGCRGKRVADRAGARVRLDERGEIGCALGAATETRDGFGRAGLERCSDLRIACGEAREPLERLDARAATDAVVHGEERAEHAVGGKRAPTFGGFARAAGAAEELAARKLATHTEHRAVAHAADDRVGRIAGLGELGGELDESVDQRRANRVVALAPGERLLRGARGVERDACSGGRSGDLEQRERGARVVRRGGESCAQQALGALGRHEHAQRLVAGGDDAVGHQHRVGGLRRRNARLHATALEIDQQHVVDAWQQHMAARDAHAAADALATGAARARRRDLADRIGEPPEPLGQVARIEGDDVAADAEHDRRAVGGDGVHEIRGRFPRGAGADRAGLDEAAVGAIERDDFLFVGRDDQHAVAGDDGRLRFPRLRDAARLAQRHREAMQPLDHAVGAAHAGDRAERRGVDHDGAIGREAGLSATRARARRAGDRRRPTHMSVAAIEAEQPVDLLEALGVLARGDDHDVGHQQRLADGEEPREVRAAFGAVDHDAPSHAAVARIEAPHARRGAALTGVAVAFVGDEDAVVDGDRGQVADRAVGDEVVGARAAAADLAHPELVARIGVDGAHALAFAEIDAIAEDRRRRGHVAGFGAKALDALGIGDRLRAAVETAEEALVELERPDLAPGLVGIAALRGAGQRRSRRPANRERLGVFRGGACARDLRGVHARDRREARESGVGAGAIADAVARHRLERGVRDGIGARKIRVRGHAREQRERLVALVGSDRALGKREGRSESGRRETTARGGRDGPVLTQHALGGARLHVAESLQNRRIREQEALRLVGHRREHAIALGPDADHARAVLVEQATRDAGAFGGILASLRADVLEERLRGWAVGDRGRRGLLLRAKLSGGERPRHEQRDRTRARHKQGAQEPSGRCEGRCWHRGLTRPGCTYTSSTHPRSTHPRSTHPRSTHPILADLGTWREA